MNLFVLFLVSIAAVGVVIYLARAAPRVPPTAAFTPDLKNDKEVIVKGWTETELRQIIANFEKLYSGRLGAAFSVTLNKTDEGVRLLFPQDIPAEEFGFLVNYLHYPEGFDLKGRSISVVGRTTLSREFNCPEESMIGQRAAIYVPANDTEYDLVYVGVGGRTYENSFAARNWKAVTGPRVPSGLSLAP
jgi:hypothetical protein